MGTELNEALRRQAKAHACMFLLPQQNGEGSDKQFVRSGLGRQGCHRACEAEEAEFYTLQHVSPVLSPNTHRN